MDSNNRVHPHAVNFIKDLQKLKNPERAHRDQRYFKSSREHWGVSVPQCEALAKRLSKGLDSRERLTIAKRLWETDQFDPMVCAAKILSLESEPPSRELWYLLCDFLKKIDGWALEDHLAHVAWKCVLHDESLLDEIQEWTRHTNFWMRRAALVYTLPFAKPGHNPERMLQWASTYAPDPEWFIQKAIGWWLRVLSEHNPKRVARFLNEHWELLKAVAKKRSYTQISQ